jgi:hypothetical protein
MTINVKDLKRVLEIVSAGVSTKPIIEQSGCIVFLNDRIVSYNDEVAVQVPYNTGITAAVPAEPLIALVNRCSQPTVDLELSEGRLWFKTKRYSPRIVVQEEVTLPFDQKFKPPEKFIKLQDSDEFCRAMAFCEITISTDTQFMEFCGVHVASDAKGSFVESTDRYRVTRKYFSTHQHHIDIIIPTQAVKFLKGQDIRSVGESNGWLYFKLPDGIVLGCFTVEAKYPDYGAPLREVLGEAIVKIELPKRLPSMLDRAAIFAQSAEKNDEVVELTFGKGKLKLHAEGKFGDIPEWCRCDYDGAPITIQLRPDHVKDILTIGDKITIYENDVTTTGKSFFHTVRRIDGAQKPEEDEGDEDVSDNEDKE